MNIMNNSFFKVLIDQQSESKRCERTLSHILRVEQRKTVSL